MKRLAILLMTVSLPATAYPNLCLPDHETDYVQAYAESKTAIDQFWRDSQLGCDQVGEFLDYFEVKDPPYGDFTEKARCSWGGTAHGIALFSHQRAAECSPSSCTRLGAYVSRNVGKTFCAIFELYTVDPVESFLRDLEKPVCTLPRDECILNAELHVSTHCKALWEANPDAWARIIQQTCGN